MLNNNVIIIKEFICKGDILLLDVIKKSLKPFDYLILIAALIMFTNFDYNNLNLIDKIYIATFVIWFIMLAVRVYIIYRGENDT